MNKYDGEPITREEYLNSRKKRLPEDSLVDPKTIFIASLLRRDGRPEGLRIPVTTIVDVANELGVRAVSLCILTSGLKVTDSILHGAMADGRWEPIAGPPDEFLEGYISAHGDDVDLS